MQLLRYLQRPAQNFQAGYARKSSWRLETTSTMSAHNSQTWMVFLHAKTTTFEGALKRQAQHHHGSRGQVS
jgi:hypothetical protein